MLKLRPKDIVYLLLYALPNTILSFGIVYIINNALAGKEEFQKDYMGIVLLSTVVYTYILNIVFQKRLNKFSFEWLYDNEKKVFFQILKAPLQKLEKLGSQRFYTAVEDLRTFSFLPFTVTHTVNSVLMLVLCLVYMFTLSIFSAFIVVGLIAGVTGCYFIIVRSMSKQVAALRKYNEHYYKHVDDVIKGFKELKLSFFRRENLMNNFLTPNRDQAMNLDFKISYVFLSINIISQYGLYFVVAVILFILPALGLLSSEDVVAYVVIILFISGPINNLINLQQMFTRFKVANSRIKKFIEDFEMDDDAAHSEPKKVYEFQSLRFKDISFAYNNENEEVASFAIGPLNLDIERGETIFIVGGNGSGKSTFLNILTGLYKPTGGDIIINGREKTAVSDSVQNLMAAVFSDNHIFSNNYDEYTLQNNARYTQFLGTMQLGKIINNDNDESARRKLSKGQSKRMSLIFALLENKPILVLDEWAARPRSTFQEISFTSKYYQT